MDYKKLIKELKDIKAKNTIVSGRAKINYDSETKLYFCTDVKNLSILIGKLKKTDIIDSLLEGDFSLDKEGFYDFDAVFYYEPAEYFEDEIISHGHCYIEHIEFNFVKPLHN